MLKIIFRKKQNYSEIIDKSDSNLRYFHDAKNYILKKQNCSEICRDEVGNKFVEESLEQCDFLLLNIFSTQNNWIFNCIIYRR